MRIWLLTSEWNSSGVDDLSRWARGYPLALAAVGHEVTVFGPEADDRARVSSPGIWYVGLSGKVEASGAADEGENRSSIDESVLSHWPAVSYRLADRVLEHAVQSGPPEIIEAQSMYGLPYFLLQRILTQNTPLNAIPFVVDALGSHVGRLEANEASPYRLPDYWIGRMELFCLRAAELILSVSPLVEQEVRAKFDGTPHLVRFAPSPWQASKEADCEPAPSVLECTLPLERRTGVLRLVDQCASLWKRGAEFRLSLIGADSRCCVRDRPLSRVIGERHPGWVKSGALVVNPGGPGIGSGVLVFPPCGGDFGTACAEALAPERPVIAARGGDPASLLGVHAPTVYDPDDPDSLHSAIRVAGGAIRRVSGGLPVADAIRERTAMFQGLIDRPTLRRAFPSVGVPAPEADRRGDSSESGVANRLSVVIPFYNLGEFIDDTISSVRATDWPDREIVVVDDGSTDPASVASIDRLAAGGATDLRIIRTANQGPAAARNTGAESATGEFIALLDADDLVEPLFFRRCIDVLRRYDDVGFVYSWVRYFGAADGLWPTWNAELPYLLGHNLLTVFIVMRRTDYLRFGLQHRDFASDYEDYDGFISMVEAGFKGVALPDPLVRYRIRPESRHRGYHSDQSLHLYRLLTTHHAASYQRYGAELFNLQLANGASRFWSNPAVTPFDPLARIAELERLHTQSWEEGQKIAAAWETQRTHIEAQAVRIAELDAAYVASQAEAGRATRNWETQQLHIDDQRRRIDELEGAFARRSAELEQLLDEHRSDLDRQTALATEYEAEARRLGEAWTQVTAHNAEQAARIAELDAALRNCEAEAARLSAAWATQRAEIGRLSARIAELKTLRGWLRTRGRE